MIYLVFLFVGIFLFSLIADFIESSFDKKEKKKKSPKPTIVLTDEFQEILDLLNNSNESVFITGKAGTGKSTLLKHFIANTDKRFVILAPTGVAALNVGGQTIHSFFRFPPSIIRSEKIVSDYSKYDLYQNLEVVIVDEVSMVRADLMDGIDKALRKNMDKPNLPFGGVQMVFIGDLFQLPPVLTDRDRNYILNKYGGQYFFDATVFKTFQYRFKELTRIFRQSDEQTEFKSMLNNIRNNKVRNEDFTLLNSRYKENAEELEDFIFLTTRRKIARRINKDRLENLPGQKFVYKGDLSGKYLKLKAEKEGKLEDKLPAPYLLELKIGAQIMMLKNDVFLRWVNGSIGRIVKLEEDVVQVNIGGKRYKIHKDSWDEIEYEYSRSTGGIEEKIVSRFKQFPLQLSYAMTIHKSQGKTFDNIIVDVGTGAFAHGQVYVALSRCTTLEGIILNNPIYPSDIIVDTRVIEYYDNRAIPVSIQPQAMIQENTTTIKEVVFKAIKGEHKVKIFYENFNGEISERLLSNLYLTDEFDEYGYDRQHIKAFCHLRDEERSFKISRIKRIEIVE